jgi:TldD protein
MPVVRMAARSLPILEPLPRSTARDSVLEVMARELTRSMDGLQVPGSPKPYFMQYTLRRAHTLRLKAAYGSLVKAREAVQSQIYADVRVGSHKFDNVMDGGLDTRAEERESSDWVDAPDDLDLAALQVSLWKLSQLKFDEAQQDYYDHRKALVSEYLRDEVDAFSRETPLVHREELRNDPFPRAAWEGMLRDLSRRFLQHPEVHDPAITLVAERVHRWLATSEGTRVVTEDTFVELSIGGWILTEDGVYTEASRDLYMRSVEEVPSRATLERLLDDVIVELGELQKAETPGSFIGPALLAGQAASTLFHEALGHRLEGERLVARGETRTFAQKVGQRILPKGLDVFDDPTITRLGDRSVYGSYRVDDQGVPAMRATLVEDGVLKGFLQSRNPTAVSSKSNGHGRHDGVQPPTARMANFVVEPRPGTALTWEQLEAKLVEVAKSQGRRHALIIHRVRAGETQTQAYDFQVFKGEPAEVWLLDVETGKRRRVRDIELIGTPLSALQRIVAFGGDPDLDQGYCYAESGSIPVSGIAPAILLSEVEMQQGSTTGFHEPLLPPPFADDGSHGRTSALRRRGRRRRETR